MVMKKAWTADGRLILARHFNPDLHGSDLSCADPNCGAKMLFRQGGLVDGNAARREDHFYSQKVSQHAANCTEHFDTQRQARAVKSLKRCLSEGGRVLLNLNIDLDRTPSLKKEFSHHAAAPKGIGASLSIKSAEQLIETASSIGRINWDRLYVNYQGYIQAYEDFLIETPSQYRALVKNLYRLPGGPKAEGLPKLITFRATRNTRIERNKNFRGSPVTLTARPGASLILLQHATSADRYGDALRDETMMLLARPRLDRERTAKTFFNYNAGNGGEHYVSLFWQINSAAQFTPVISAPTRRRTLKAQHKKAQESVAANPVPAAQKPHKEPLQTRLL